MKGLWCAISLLSLAALLSIAAISASAQHRHDPVHKIPAPEKRTWRVQVSKDALRSLTIKAVDSPLVDVVNEIGKQLGVQMRLSPLMMKQRLSLDIKEIPLETALRMLAPQVYADYEISGGATAKRKYLAFYLTALNEEPPEKNAIIKGHSETFIMEGSTEDEPSGAKAKAAQNAEELKLSVTYKDNRLTVLARKQSLILIAAEIASKVGASYELQYDSPEILDVDIKDYTLDDAVRKLSPSVRGYFRLDFQSNESQPLRIVLARPEKT